MRVGIVGNLEDPEAGFVEERLEALGASFDRRWRSSPADLDGFERDVDLLVHLGSEWSVYSPPLGAEIDAERSLIARATVSGCPVLGLCFGGQMVASSIGRTVAKAPVGEIGWVTVESDDERLIGPGPWFEYHLDRWDEADDERAIARNAAGPQALVVGRTLGLQFHPEVTEEVIRRWIWESPERVVGLGGDPEEIVEMSVREMPGARTRCFELVDRFLAHALEVAPPVGRPV